jgi:hypothetical protein
MRVRRCYHETSWLMVIIIILGLNSCVVNSFRFGISAFSAVRCQNRCKKPFSLKLTTCLASAASSLSFNQPSTENPFSNTIDQQIYYVQNEHQLMESMKYAIEIKSFSLFLRLFSLFATKIKNSSRKYLSFKEKNELLYMTNSFLSPPNTCSGMAIVSLLSCFADCGFSVKNQHEREFLNNLRKMYLTKSNKHNGIFIITYLKSVAKLSFSWKRLRLDDERAMIALIARASEDIKEITAEYYYQLFSSISLIDIPWNCLTNQSRSVLLENMKEMTSHYSLISKSMFISALSSIKFFNFFALSESISTTFLKLVQDCLEGCHHDDVKAPGRQVCICCCSFYFVFCLFAVFLFIFSLDLSDLLCVLLLSKVSTAIDALARIGNTRDTLSEEMKNQLWHSFQQTIDEMNILDFTIAFQRFFFECRSYCLSDFFLSSLFFLLYFLILFLFLFMIH